VVRQRKVDLAGTGIWGKLLAMGASRPADCMTPAAAQIFHAVAIGRFSDALVKWRRSIISKTSGARGQLKSMVASVGRSGRRDLRIAVQTGLQIMNRIGLVNET
jgi:hypothetical protein